MRLPARPNGAGGATSGTETAIAGEPYMLNGQPIGRCTSVAGDFALVMVTRAHLGAAVALASP